jgi:hypothetical protein
MLIIAKKILAEYYYIYDPDHRKNPGGDYVKTRRGWSRGKGTGGRGKPVYPEMNDSQKNLHEMARNGKNRIRREIAQNPDTHMKTLDKLSSLSDDEIRVNVAKNPNTHPATLKKMTDDRNISVLMNVAKHKNSSQRTLKKLSVHKSEHVRAGVANNTKPI